MWGVPAQVIVDGMGLVELVELEMVGEGPMRAGEEEVGNRLVRITVPVDVDPVPVPVVVEVNTTPLPASSLPVLPWLMVNIAPNPKLLRNAEHPSSPTQTL